MAEVTTDCGEDELLALEARFRALACEWRLGRQEAAALLGLPGAALGLDLVPLRPDGVAETRMRLLVEVRSLLPTLLRDPTDAPDWLRERVDEEAGGTETPMEFLAGPLANVRAFARVLRVRAEPSA